MKIKKYLYSLLSFSAALALGSCSDELMPADKNQAVEEPIELTITVARGNTTRTELSENDTNGGLNDVWKQGDKIHVYNSQGVEKGTLSLLSNFDGENAGVFSGTVTLASGSQELSFWYYVEDSNSNLYIGSKIGNLSYNPSLIVDLSTQNFSNLTDLAKMDILCSKVSVNVQNKTIELAEDVTLNPLLAFARFSLPATAEFKTGTQGVLTIYNYTDRKTSTKLQKTLAVGSYEDQIVNDEGHIVIDNVKAGDDIYVAFIPGQYQLGFRFVADNGSTYKYNLQENSEINAGVYYTSFSKNEGAENGTFAGIPINLVKDKGAADHTKNPLLKWAPTNLDLSTESGFAENLWDLGQFFQFGRNCGYSGYEDAQERYALYCSKSTDYPENVWGFPVFYGTSNYNVQHVEMSYTYESIKDSGEPSAYFLINNKELGGSDNDWWPERENKNDSWSERALAEGWSKGDPSPEGYRIATSADYAEIMPKEIIDSELLKVFFTSEIRTNLDCKYAIQWGATYVDLGNEIRYLMCVRTLVLDNDNPESLSKINWNDTNNPNIRAILFPSAGYIRGNYTKTYVSYSNNPYYPRYSTDPYIFYADNDPSSMQGKKGLGYFRLSMPIPAGKCDIAAGLYGTTVVSSYNDVCLFYSSIYDYSNIRTSYWTADGKCFGFSIDETGKKYKDDPYYISMQKTYPKFYGMPVRCVRVN